MHVFRFQQLAINCTFAKREKCKQHYRILREVDINIIITKNDNIDGAGNLPKLYLLNILIDLAKGYSYIFLNRLYYAIYNSKKRIKGYRILEMSIFRFLKLNPFYLQIQTFSFLRVI